jgi:hypothetical protein
MLVHRWSHHSAQPLKREIHSCRLAGTRMNLFCCLLTAVHAVTHHAIAHLGYNDANVLEAVHVLRVHAQ